MSHVDDTFGLDALPDIDLGLGTREERAGQRVVIAMSGGLIARSPPLW